MCFWWFMLICDLMIPIMMIIIGWMMWKHSPQKINRIMGYRTSRSMKNMDTWRFAHEHSGRLWWKIGWFTLVPSMIVHVPIYGSTDSVIGIVGVILVTIQIVLLIGAIFPTEKALKKEFNEDGSRKSNN